MLTEKRYSLILEIVNSNGSARIQDLCSALNTSESTRRRDLNALSESVMLKKVHGGAVALNDNFSLTEHTVEEKEVLFIEEKTAIAQYAASLVNENDFIYIDAGTTTEKMIGFLKCKNVTCVTNGFINAKKLALQGFKVFIPSGEIKASTESVIGAECVNSLQNFNFTKCFMGVNGISKPGGLTTPDTNEAAVKRAAIERSRDVFILADHSKFDKITSVRFAPLNVGKIITDRLSDMSFLSDANIKEVFK